MERFTAIFVGYTLIDMFAKDSSIDTVETTNLGTIPTKPSSDLLAGEDTTQAMLTPPESSGVHTTDAVNKAVWLPPGLVAGHGGYRGYVGQDLRPLSFPKPS